MVLVWFGYFYPEQSQLLTWATGQSDKQDKTQTCNDDNLIFHLFKKIGLHVMLAINLQYLNSIF